MASYFRDNKGKIYGDVANRLGKIMLQYKEKIDQNDKENFDSTLVICALQSLLAMYTEAFSDTCCDFLKETINLRGEHNKNFEDIESDNFFEFKKKFIITDDWEKEEHGPRRSKKPKPFSISCHLFSLRNALSHPSIKEDATGYDAIPDENNRITEYIFIHRPNDGPKKRVYIISSDDLYTIAIQLSKLLAQPIQPNWDNRLDLNILTYAA